MILRTLDFEKHLNTLAMDLTKLGTSSWSEPGKQQETSAVAKSVAKFVQDVNQHGRASSLHDLSTASRMNGRHSSTQGINKTILFSSTSPLILPSVKRNLSNFEGINSSSTDSNLSKTIQFGEI